MLGLSLDALSRMKERSGDPNMFKLTTGPVVSQPPSRHPHSHSWNRSRRRGRKTEPLFSDSSHSDAGSEGEDASLQRSPRHSHVGAHSSRRVDEHSPSDPPGAGASSNLFDFLNRTVARAAAPQTASSRKRARIAHSASASAIASSAAAEEDLTQLSNLELNRRVWCY